MTKDTTQLYKEASVSGVDMNIPEWVLMLWEIVMVLTGLWGLTVVSTALVVGEFENILYVAWGPFGIWFVLTVFAFMAYLLIDLAKDFEEAWRER